MLDRLLANPWIAVGFILFVIYLAGVYFMNRERSKVQNLKGPRRFQPDWDRRGRGGRRRRRRRKTSFKPEWSSREGSRTARPGSAKGDSTEDPAPDG